MSFLHRLLRTAPDPREAWRPLWHRLVIAAREEHWYADAGVADTLDGRFDMVSMLTALAILRLESEADEGIPAAARLTELFVEDMEGQMREAGIGDPTVGKKINALMESMNGRIGAYREGLRSDPKVLIDAVRRNVTMAQPDEAEALVQRMAALHSRLARTSIEQLKAGEIAA